MSELADIEHALQLAETDRREVCHIGTSEGLPFGAGLEVDGLGSVPLPITRHASVLRSGADGAESGDGLNSWPAGDFKFANPEWSSRLRALCTAAKQTLQLPQV